MNIDAITGRRLLYVDDEQMALKYFQMCLGDDVEVVTCSSAAEALKILESGHERFDAVISDDRMPTLSGGDLLGVVAERWPRVSRILTTAFTDIERLADLLAGRQVHRVIMKPWDRTELRETIGLTIHKSDHDLEFASRSGDITFQKPDVLKMQLPPDMLQEIDASETLARFPRRLSLHCAPNLAVQVSIELELARELQAPKLELSTCTVMACLDEAFGYLGSGGMRQASIEYSWLEPIYVHSNPSCLGSALAEVIGTAILATRGGKSPTVLLDVTTKPEWIQITIVDNGDWSREGLSSWVFDEVEVEDDPRPGVGFPVALWVILGSGGRTDVVTGDNGQPNIVIIIPRARN